MKAIALKNPRAIAAKIVNQVIKQQSSLDALLDTLPEQKDLGFIKELCFGTLRWYQRLNKIAEQLLNKPLSNKYSDIHALLLIGLYQLLYLKTPQHAAVYETAEATVQLEKSWAKALINKTLRLCISNEEKLLTKADETEEGLYSHPAWLIGKIKKAFPENYDLVFKENNQRAPLCLRVNSQKITRDDFLNLLAENNIVAHAVDFVPSAVQLEQAIPVQKIPGFSEGFCSVQDAAGQLAAFILKPTASQHILDACAAPGSKATHLLEMQAHLAKLVAVDLSAERLKMLEENIQRLQLDKSKLDIITADATQEFSNELFDSILLDAPCSGTGVIRRHPDIKILRRPEDVIEQCALQAKLLKTLWALLKPGGHLVYSTCSILPEENEKQMIKFLSQYPDATSIPLSLTIGTQLMHGVQIRPGEQEADGFYYCLLEKILS